MTDNAFAPLSAEEIKAAPTSPKAPAWRVMMPASEDAPAMKLTLAGKSPDHQWEYRDQQGQLLGYVQRFDQPGGGKEIRPATYCTHAKQPSRWRHQGFPEPRPLYALDRLASRPEALVIVCEGEKAADAATALFGDCVAVSSAGGADAADKANWSPLAGRQVSIWPDADEAGARYAGSVIASLKQVQAASIALVDVSGLPDHWDLADTLPDGMTTSNLRGMLETAIAQDISLILPAGFERRAEGWYADGQWIAGSFNIVGQARDISSNHWGLYLEWHDSDDQRHGWIMPFAALANDASSVRERFLSGGLRLSHSRPAKDALIRLLAGVETNQRVLTVHQIGWRDRRFVMPGRVYGAQSNEKIELSATVSSDFATAGTLDDWRTTIARPAASNSRLVLAISIAFAGPLMQPIDPMNFGIHLRGTSRSGKTTALRAAASVWGHGGDGGFIKTWRSTDNGLEGIAAARNDTLLCLDEMGQADGKSIGSTVYMLSNGAGKQRASRDGSARALKTWRMPFLSTGELSLEAKMLETGGRVRAGQEMRLLDIPADAGADMGVFDDIGDFDAPNELADHIAKSACHFYGTAAEAFLGRLVTAELDELRRDHQRIQARFRDNLVPYGANSQVVSVANRFAMTAFAGELAAAWQIVPWAPDTAYNASARCFHNWLDNRGSHGLHEVDAGLKQVQSFLQQYGESRFEQLSNEGISEAYPLRDKAGCRTSEDGIVHFLVFPQVFTKEICQGFDAKLIAQTLRDRSHLRHADGRLQVQRRLPPASKKQWVYCISSSVLEGDENAGR